MNECVVIGDATLYLGDCMDVLATLQHVDCVVTDPPYGIGYSSEMGGKFKDWTITSDESLDARDLVLAHLVGIPALVFGSWKRTKPANTRHTLIWDKGDHVGMGDLSVPWKPNFEEIYVIGTGFSGHRGSSIIRINAPSPNFTPDALRYHPTEKPVALIAELLYKCPSGVILDPFMGSASIGVAALQMGRHFIGIEIDPRYFAIACERIERAQKQSVLFHHEPTRKHEQMELAA